MIRREKVEIDSVVLAVLVSRLGGSVRVSAHDAADVDPRSTLRIFHEARDSSLTIVVQAPLDSGAIDAEFKVLA